MTTTVQQDDSEDRAVVKRAKELARAQDRACTFLEPHRIRVTSIKLIDETKSVLEWRYLRDKTCVFHMLMPVLHTRSAHNVLYATVTWSQPHDVMKRMFTESAHEAAMLAVPVALINFEEALAIFKAEFWRLIKERALQSFECLIPELIMVKAVGGWRPAGWPEPKEPEAVESQ